MNDLPPPRIHPTALIEEGVVVGPGTSVWDGVHIRHRTRIGARCIIGEKSHISYDVTIGDLVKINAHVTICTGITIERGVMIAAGTVFTNDRYPRATTPDLAEPWTSEPDHNTLSGRVREGASIGVGARIGPGLTIGRFAMVGMAAVVTADVPDFALVVGHPARRVGWCCRCGPRLPEDTEPRCGSCGRRYRQEGPDRLVELDD